MFVCVGEWGGTHDAGEGEHSKAAVLDLGQLEAGAVGALAEAKGVEAEVSGLAAGILKRDGRDIGMDGREEGGGEGNEKERRGVDE